MITVYHNQRHEVDIGIEKSMGNGNCKAEQTVTDR